jgi:hypothetical protein
MLLSKTVPGISKFSKQTFSAKGQFLVCPTLNVKKWVFQRLSLKKNSFWHFWLNPVNTEKFEHYFIYSMKIESTPLTVI